MWAIARRAVRSSSTTSTDPREGDFEAAPTRSGADESHVAAELPGERAADREPDAESFVAVPLMVVHLIELVEQVRDAGRGNSRPRVEYADRDVARVARVAAAANARSEERRVGKECR